MKNAVILCAGAGTKFWPYAEIRCKAMMPVSNKPIVAYSVDALTEMGYDNIVIVGSKFIEEIYSYFRDYKNVTVICDDKPKGTAYSLLKAKDLINGDFLCLYGDTIVDETDLKALAEKYDEEKKPVALVAEITGKLGDYIGCKLDGDKIDSIWGHSRDESTHHFGGFAFSKDIFDILAYNSCRFVSADVGMMIPVEGYLESSLADELRRGKMEIAALEAKETFYDIDRPWDALRANGAMNAKKCSALTCNELAEGAYIDESATISGYVKLGKNSFIGKNVIIMGNIIVGDNTKIMNGALVSGDVVIGNDCSIRNACFIEGGSTIGNECIVSHAAELDGMILNRVYLYHYMEWFGIIGENTDLGAATVCGSLRFDDSITLQNVKGRREFHDGYGDAVFLGDYCRTGVNAIFMPGTKVGVYSIVGAGVLLNKDVPNNTIIYNEQNLKEKSWGTNKYGW